MASDIEFSGDLREQLTRLVREYLSVRSQGPWPLSTARQRLDVPDASDRQLATLIAEVAVSSRLRVSPEEARP